MPLTRLPAGSVHLAQRLMEEWEYHSHRCLAEVMFEGRQDGTVFVDDPRRPRTALLCPANGFYFACGEVNAALIAETLPELRRSLDPKAFLNATTAAWKDALAPMFAHAVPRLGFVRDGSAGAASPLPPGFEMTPVTVAIASAWSRRPDRMGMDPWIFEIWGGPERFEEQSFGFAVVKDGEAVAFTAACAIGGGEAEVEVGTAAPFRRRGLATATCLAFIAECERRGLEPTWTADSSNGASLALAARLGYRATEEMWGFPLESEALSGA